MAGEAEEKRISKLDFDINNAIKKLETIDSKLKQVSETSEKYAEKIGNSLNSGFDKKVVEANIVDVQKSYANMTRYEKNRAADVAAYRQKQEIKTTEMLKREHAKQAQSVQTLSDKISNYAKTYLIYQGFNQLKHAVSDTIEEMVNLEYQMVAIDRVLNESSLNIDRYRDKLIQLAYDYGNSMDNVTDIALRLAQAGYSSNEVLALTGKTLLALNTAELDATEATSDMVAVMAQWGLMTGSANEQAEEYASIIDKVNKVADRYPTTSADLLDALKKTSSAFNLAGASIDETIALIAAAEVSSQRGGKAIGTALSNISQQLKDEGRITIAESLGLDFYTDETKTQFKDIVEIFTEMSQKMEELKAAGKENSVEMQNLLSIFTVFRRNIGASLLGEMSGEDSLYLEILETSMNSLGYSALENSKHMQTAKAAQAQFNATLLKLKTEVWDGGLEDVFRSMLLLGTNLVEGITSLVDVFGAVPVTIGTVVAAISALNKNMKLITKVEVETADGTKKMVRQYNDWVLKIKSVITEIKEQNIVEKTLRNGQQKMSVNIGGITKDLTTYAAKTALATLKTIGLEAATIALNAAMTMGLSFAITAMISGIDALIHKQEKYVETLKENQEALQEAADKAGEHVDSLKEYAEEYEEIMSKDTREVTDDARIYEIQEGIIRLLGDKAEKVELITRLTSGEEGAVLGVNEAYKEQLGIINNLTLQKQIEEANKLKEAANSATAIFKSEEFDISMGKVKKGLKEINSEYVNIADSWAFDALNNNNKIVYLKQWKKELEEIINDSKNFDGDIKKVEDAYHEVINVLDQYTGNQDAAKEATSKWGESVAEVIASWLKINNVVKSSEDLEKILNVIAEKDYTKLQELIGIDFEDMGLNISEDELDNVEEFADLLNIFIQKQFPDFSNELNIANGHLQNWETSIKSLTKELSGYATQYDILKKAQDEYNSTGQLTISTFASLIDNKLLSYLTFVDGKLKINTQSMLDLAEAKKIEAIESLQAAAAADIQKVAEGDLENISNTAKVAIANVGTNSQTAGNKMQTAAAKAAQFATGLQAVVDASKGKLGAGVDIDTFTRQANQIINAYQGIANSISNFNITSPSYNPQSASGSSGKTAAERAAEEAERAAEEAKKAAEEEYKRKLELFTDYVDEMEREEARWVKAQKELGVLSNNDEKYIIQQRIARYEKYLKQIKEMTWLSVEDRLKLEEEYTEEIEDLQLDYMELIKDQLDDEIKAIETANKERIEKLKDAADERIDKLKEENEIAIELIEQEADRRIEALQAVEKENDRIRAKEEYERNRKAHLDDISYWEQRTGREAQEALVEARKALEDLDRDWEQQLEDWKIEDQIAKIEEERDTEIAAIEARQEKEIESIETTRDAEIAAIEEAQQKEIDALQAVYDAKVKMYSETSQIIYEASKIESQALFNSYKTNFIDPISDELKKMYAEVPAPAVAPTTSTQAQQQYETYTIKRGDTLSAIASRYGTTVSKLMEANPYITNKNMIYAGKTLQIPKFHEGGIVGGNQEALALLKPNEVILKTEWAASLNRMMKYFDNLSMNNSEVLPGGPTIEVNGDLIKIEATVRNQNDINNIEKKVEKVLKDKFNIKK